MKFKTTVLLEGKTATGLQVPDAVIAKLDAGKRPAVRITINGYSYRTTAMFMGGRFMVPLAAENRAGAGVSAGDEVEVQIELDTATREVVVPPDLAAALAAEPSAQAFFDQLPFTYRKEWVRWVEDAKKPETRQARLARTIEGLLEGRKTH
jgi:Bacteriocin-protection, YdeI or OmpD-Associated/Domain of unknown function (DUF1905)